MALFSECRDEYAQIRLTKPTLLETPVIASCLKRVFHGNGMFMPDLHLLLRGPYFQLIFGVISFSAAVVWTYTGKAWARFHGWVYRAEEPTDFWGTVAMYYLIGVFLIGYFLYKAYGLSN